MMDLRWTTTNLPIHRFLFYLRFCCCCWWFSPHSWHSSSNDEKQDCDVVCSDNGTSLSNILRILFFFYPRRIRNFYIIKFCFCCRTRSWWFLVRDGYRHSLEQPLECFSIVLSCSAYASYSHENVIFSIFASFLNVYLRLNIYLKAWWRVCKAHSLSLQNSRSIDKRIFRN